MEEDASQKTFDPTPRKLEEARRKGDVPKSQDLVSVLILATAAAMFIGLGSKISSDLVAYGRIFLERPHEISVGNGDMTRLTLDVFKHTGLAVGTFFGALSVAALAGHTGQTGLMFVTDKLAPKPEKISPIAGFKRIFGKEALMQFGKTLFKIMVLGIVAYYALKPFYFKAGTFVDIEPQAMGPVLILIMKTLLFQLLLVLILFAIGDFFMQRMNFMNRNKMSKQEMKDEYKQTEGDPIIAAKIKQIRFQKAKQRMIQNVPKATVIITNPTHYAIALRYVTGETAAPICLAKGLDNVALKIREVANEHKIPIIEDPPLARALFKDAEIDAPIPSEFYQAVAKIIGTILSIAARRKSSQAAPPRITPPSIISAPFGQFN
ncbi:MAG: flagellar biosynthetic protein FlhB [Hyphomonadaceae bacterium]|nr:MAG: flagellar biosynthetic protein FlhB [Hyphomonadaceae bacterium]KAF0184232.1 MAG: flagellar biosynthetic protein FlhB [Hyphomonadaceae bacterium]